MKGKWRIVEASADPWANLLSGGVLKGQIRSTAAMRPT